MSMPRLGINGSIHNIITKHWSNTQILQNNKTSGRLSPRDGLHNDPFLDKYEKAEFIEDVFSILPGVLRDPGFISEMIHNFSVESYFKMDTLDRLFLELMARLSAPTITVTESYDSHAIPSMRNHARNFSVPVESVKKTS